MKGRIVFVIGGARSGKSLFAHGKAAIFPGRKAYIATAEPRDDEMRERIEEHRRQRGDEWDTCEEPVRIARALRGLKGGYGAVVVDCLTLWLSNLIVSTEGPDRETADFLEFLRHGDYPPLFIVSNEVGMGIVPDNALSRSFRDLAGHLNQTVAGIADEVYLVTAGIPMKIKP